MSSLTAIVVVLGLFAVGLAPLALAAARVIGWAPVTLFSSVVILGAASYQAGLFAPRHLQLPNVSADESGLVPRAQCAEVITALEEAGVIIDRRTPPRLIVNRDRWSQLPEEASGVILDCVQRAWPAGSASPELEMRAQ